MHEQLGDYELISLMSSGGMAELYLAVSTGQSGQIRKVVALKRVLPDAAKDPDAVARFLDEAKLTVSLNHKNIASVFDLGEADGEMYLAMEFIVGVDLARLISQGPVPPGFVLRVAHDVAAALAYAHDDIDPISGQPRCVIHRDLTPRNVMITFDGEVKVIDFGLAHFRGRIARTAQGMVRGTAQYMPPEQLRAQPLDGRTDLYSLGVVLWELLAGRELISGGHEDVLERVARGDLAPPIASVASDVPAPLARIVDTLLDPRPAARIQSAKELQRALLKCNAELFDGERVATFLKNRLPQTGHVLRSLVALAGSRDASEAALKDRLKQLRRADRDKSLAVTDEPIALTEVAAAQQKRPWQPIAIFGAIAALGIALAAWKLDTPAPEVHVRTWQEDQAAELAQTQLRDRDPLTAFATLRNCVTPAGPCKGLEAELNRVKQQLSESVCGSDAKAQEIVSNSRKLALVDDRVRALETCRAGRFLHPLAAREIERVALMKLSDGGPAE